MQITTCERQIASRVRFQGVKFATKDNRMKTMLKTFSRAACIASICLCFNSVAKEIVRRIERTWGIWRNRIYLLVKKNRYNRIALDVIIAFARMVFFSMKLFIDKKTIQEMSLVNLKLDEFTSDAIAFSEG